MKITKIFIFIIIGVTLASFSTAHPVSSIGGWCNASNPCGQGMLCIGNKCFDINALVSNYRPVNESEIEQMNMEKATSDGARCDSSTPCVREMQCIINKCFDISAIALKYGPVNVNSDGDWCDTSNLCAQDMLCSNNECIDRNRVWGSKISDENDDQYEVVNFDVRSSQE